MKDKLVINLILLLIMTVGLQLEAFAGGPLVVKRAMAVSYGTRPFLYRYDKGTLGMFSNSEAIAIIEDLFDDWETIKTASLNFKQDSPGSLDFDVTSDNFGPVLNSDDLLGYTPIIFDNDGTVLDAFLGDGAGNSVLGLSGPITVSSGPLVNQIAESQAIFNGKFVNGINKSGDPESSTDSFKGTIIHEVGHGVGLDHAQINVEAIRPGATTEIRDSVPLEFPVAVNDLFLIRRDDASSISLLYPNSVELKKYGTIEGKIFRQDGATPIQGANVIARNVNDPLLEAISCVSDYLVEGSGRYTLFAVPPGDYTIEIEPIDISFTGGSGVGPFTQSKTDKSFQNPVPKGYYTGPDQSITLAKNEAVTVNVKEGQVIEDANIIASTTKLPSSSSGTPQSINEEEPNNSVSQAQIITPPVIISGNAAITDDGDLELTSDTGAMVTISDLFRINLSAPGQLNALLKIESDSQNDDLDLVLLDGNGVEILDASSQTGNVDELITKSLSPRGYLLGVGAFSGSTSYTLEIQVETSAGGVPVVSLTTKDALVLKPVGRNRFTVLAEAVNFSEPSTCQVFTTSDNDILLKTRPAKFKLSPNITRKQFKVIVPKPQALELINNNTEETVTVNVTCDNGASDDTDIILTPSVDNVLERKDYNYIIRSTNK